MSQERELHLNTRELVKQELPHQFRSRRPDRASHIETTNGEKPFQILTNADHYAVDTLNKRFGDGPLDVILFSKASTVDDIAQKVRETKDTILPVGAQSAVTGGAAPDKQEVFDMSRRRDILEWNVEGDNKTVAVQTGITAYELRTALAEKGLEYPPLPTFDGATIGGNIGTNAAGRASFKYGSTRRWIEGLTVVLANGDILEIERGQHTSKDGKFEWVNSEGNKQEIPIPTYKRPDVPKTSAGYYSESNGEMDLVDLFIGAEGTLGIVTEAKLRVMEKPETLFALVSCKEADQALHFVEKLKDASEKTWKAQSSEEIGVDASGIEFIDEPSVSLLREDSAERPQIKPPEEAKMLVLVQMEMNAEEDVADQQLMAFGEILEEMQLDDTTELAGKTEQSRIEDYLAMREAVPVGVNKRIKKLKEEETARTGEESAIAKTALDLIVPFEKVTEIRGWIENTFGDEFAVYTWGHIGGGGLNLNVVPKDSAQTQIARDLVLECGLEAIKLGGSPFAEHGVGKDEDRQLLAEMLYQYDNGIAQMRAVKKTLDSDNKFSPGNIFPLV